MAKTKISEFSATPANNTDIDSINIAEGCAPSGINDAIRELMAQLKDFQTGAQGDSFNGPIGTSTAAAGAFTTLSASSTTTLSGLTASTALALDASKNVVSVTNTGTGSNVLATSPTLVTPILGTPTSATLTNATGLPISTGVSGLGTGVATFLATPSSANLRSALTDETGTGSAVFATSPTLVTPALGTPSSVVLTNATGLPNAGLVNSSITIGGTAIALGASSNALANDITVYGVTVGRGAGAVSTNTAVGASALAANTSGVDNHAVGYLAMTTNTSGSYNVALGTGALKVSNANQNAAFGHATLFGNTSGANNTAIGSLALYANTTASNNTAVGKSSLPANTTGASNTAVGTEALQANTTASNNTAVGYQAGYSNTTGSNLVALGYQAGYYSNADNNTFIGYYAGQSTTGTRNTFVGVNGVGYLVTSGTRNTIIGGFSGNQGGLDIRTLSNYIVLSDGDGNPRGIYNSSGAYWDLQARTVLSGANNGNVAELIWTRTDASYMWANQTTMRLYGQAANTTNPNTKLLETQAGSSLAIGGASTQAGSGITFPATQSASSDANTLDDYEEGTFAVTLAPNTSGTITVNTSFDTLSYIKIGSIAHIQGYIAISSVSVPVGTSIIMSGLPFVTASTAEFSDYAGAAGIVSGTIVPIVWNPSETTITFTYNASTITSADYLRFSFSYRTA